MASKIELFRTAILAVILGQVNTFCDLSTTTVVNEGNLGQANTFSWLGILRIILYERDPRHPDIAVTGVVLIKREYALINAHDVSRVPVARLKSNGRVMFIPNNDVPWYCKPKGYTAHPEYGSVTQNTIAILELDLSDNSDYPLMPICWLSQRLNTSTLLYATGFTDEHKLLEKVMYKIQYTDQESCSEFYDRAKLDDTSHTPANYICGHATSSKTHCVWDNGMVLITNASEFFSLVGFGIRGPGCAAPARFIDLQYYYEWMQEITNPKDEYEDYRRDAGFEEVPLHMLYENKETLRDDVKQSGPLKHFVYPADVESPRYFNIDDESENEGITVFPFNYTYEAYDNACNTWRILMYREHFELNALGRLGSAVFKVSLYDLLVKRCSCIKIFMDTETHSSAILSVHEEIDLTEGEALTSSEEMFENLIKVHPIQELYTEAPVKSDTWQPGPNLKPAYLKEFYKSLKVENYNLYIRFGIKDRAVMKIEMYGETFEPDYDNNEKDEVLRVKVENVSTQSHEQMWVKRPTQAPKKYKDRLPKTPFPKSGRVKTFPGVSSKALLTKSKYKVRPKAKNIKTTTTPKNLRYLNPVYTGLLPVLPNRPSSSLYNVTRHATRPPALYTRPIHITHGSYSESLPKKATPTTFNSSPAHVSRESYPVDPTKIATSSIMYPRIIQVTRRRGYKYNNVRVQTSNSRISTVYPSAFVESVSGAAGSPRGFIVLTYVKCLCFNSLVLLLNF